MTLTELKIWIRSGSLSLALSCNRQAGGDELGCYWWRSQPLYYRPGTSDPQLIYSILLRKSRWQGSGRLFRAGGKREYWVPEALAPRTILDIGANIGVTSVYYSNLFPSARIVSVEPLQENFQLLQRNVAGLRVEAHNVGLGSVDGILELFPEAHSPTNFGGYSAFASDSARGPSGREVRAREVGGFLSEAGVELVDLVKIDTEGAEYEILTAFPVSVLSRVRWIIGELHSHRDFELLAYLSKWFDIEIHKSLGTRLCQFNARNRVLWSPGV